MNSSDRCYATIEGPIARGTRDAVTWRKQCKAYPLRGYEHCVHHLTFDEKRRYYEERRRKL